ncbi:hypothetical protein [Microseira sp. BLCC-F43]|jgi:hypothetical protein|uniref:hypothetical protein n=1 Tax=Microseira sp. BLCC-F43 TaxID=3153602 RepID=UPI0035BA0519
MTPAEIGSKLAELFGADLQANAPNSWQVDTPSKRLLVLLSDDQSWLRLLIPITSAQAAQPFLEQLLEANFDTTLETRYALYQGVLWGVFQHSCESLTSVDFESAVTQLLSLHQRGISDFFNQLVESRIRQIIKAAKQQGQTLEATLQTVDRFYEEGLMGDINQGSAGREETMSAWRYQLERLWPEVS